MKLATVLPGTLAPTVRSRSGLFRALRSIDAFSDEIVGTRLRAYQVDAARAVLRSVQDQHGHSVTVMMPRQSRKNELSAQLEAFLLARRQIRGGSLVKCAPTFRPQIHTSIHRLTRTLDNPLTVGRWMRRGGYVIQLGAASIAFFSAERRANVVGATATMLLECDEAQDVDFDKWERDFRPMGATANVTSVLYGTPWTDDTLLARQVAVNRETEARDGQRRHFEVDWSRVAEENPAYGRYVEAEIARLGEHHPIIRTQYLLRTIADGGRLLDSTQLAMLQGEHPPMIGPAMTAWGVGRYVAGVDVAGEDEEDPSGLLRRINVKRDSTVLTIAYAERLDVSSLVVEPKLHIVRQYVWRGTRHRELYPRILALVREHWRCQRVVVDATGVGGGLSSFLGVALGSNVVTPFVYTAASKSQLAYDFLAAVNARRLMLYAESADADANDSRRELLAQCEAAEYVMRAHQMMTFFVPENRGHDDLLNAAALVVQAAPLGRMRAATGRRRG